MSPPVPRRIHSPNTFRMSELRSAFIAQLEGISALGRDQIPASGADMFRWAVGVAEAGVHHARGRYKAFPERNGCAIDGLSCTQFGLRRLAGIHKLQCCLQVAKTVTDRKSTRL